MSLKPSVTKLYRFLRKNKSIPMDKAKFLSIRKDWTSLPAFSEATENEINTVDENIYLYFEYKNEYAVSLIRWRNGLQVLFKPFLAELGLFLNWLTSLRNY